MYRNITEHIDPFGGAEIIISADARDPDAGNASHSYLLHRDGKPSCGELHFQHGPRGDDGLTGLTDAAVLAVVADRLDSFQAGPFACESNARALAHVRDAIDILRSRAAERKARGVLGKNLE